MSETAEYHNVDLREKIRSSLKAFESQPLLRGPAIDLLNTLGYYSDKVSEAHESSPDAFLDLLTSHNPDVEFNKEKALFDDWLKADLLFQITDEEISNQKNLFENDAMKIGFLESYLFFAIELRSRDYPRGKLTTLTRQLNRAFPMPVMVLIKHQDLLSIAVINRRFSKRDINKDVLGKVAIIRDISLTNPHPGHLDILNSFALPSLSKEMEINSFESLHAAWEKIFNVELLNKQFYSDIFKWYYWALDEVNFPDDLKPKGLPQESDQKEDEKLRATGLIRLLTRLIFCWFLKEKSLIPDDLFRKAPVENILKSLKDNESTYYQAILQNLFFATLNQKMNTGGKKHRKFAKDKGYHKNRNNHGIDNLYRYETMFKDETAALKAFANIPFLNGGLFECLDYTDDKKKKIYVDGFSRNRKKRPVVPNYLFFGEGEVDVGTVTGEAKRGTEKVRGLIEILSAYKFTITENTPIDQEVALDPELLGKVFEDLLASYNEETKTSARKQTGSFYTPRHIVEYMVDESLKAYLTSELKSSLKMKARELHTKLDELFSYTEKEHQFAPKEVGVLIKAIDNCKILDPACGSGAFPMGVLYRLVNLLTKLDPDNARWKQTQLDKLDSVSMKNELEETFANNNDDYGRKLYLIESCLYGVDIQPIAIQLSKLRFFISLICDQKTNRSKKDNFGVKPLPNLETKFVAADALIGIDRGDQFELFRNSKMDEIEEAIQKARHDHFAVQTRDKKLKIQERDRELRQELAMELAQALGVGKATSKRLADWDPYNAHFAADFFHPLWMFDQSVLDGFDVVIGNPPYRQIKWYTREEKERWGEQDYQTYAATADIYCLFYEKGVSLLRGGGHLCYITSNKWMRSGYGEKLRNFFSTGGTVRKILDFGGIQIFNSATVDTNILLLQNGGMTSTIQATQASRGYNPELELAEFASANATKLKVPKDPSESWVVVPKHQQEIKTIVEEQGEALENWDISFNMGIITSLNEAFYITSDQREAMIAENPACREILVPLLRGRFVGRFEHSWDGTWMINTHNGIKHRNVPAVDASNYPPIWKHLSEFKGLLENRQAKGDHWYNLRNCAYLDEFCKPKIIYPDIVRRLCFFYDRDENYYVSNSAYVITGNNDILPYLVAQLNSQLFQYCFKENFQSLGAHGLRLWKASFEKIALKKPTATQCLLFSKLVNMMQTAIKMEDKETKAWIYFLDVLIDACVMECYFHDHMSERTLLFHNDVLKLLERFEPEKAKDSETMNFLKEFYKTANDPKHPIRNRLMRISTDSPDFLNPIRKRDWT